MIQGRIIKINLLLILFLVPFAAAHAKHGEGEGEASSAVGDAQHLTMPSFEGWLQGFIKEAQTRGISSRTLNSAFKKVKPIKRVIELDRNQPEFKLTFDQYLSKVINKRRISRGKWRYQNYLDWIQPISDKYGVQPQYLIALWGMETDYGRLTGGFRVIDALATLAYDGRRASYFRGELLNALRIIDQGHISADDMKGSWAGAMGQTQFMPSTFLAHAVDADNDGMKNVWKSRKDALASGANYLAREGWDKTQPWGLEVILPADFDSKLLTDENLRMPLANWLDKGVKLKHAASADMPHRNTPANIVKQTGEGRTFMVFNNYHVLMKWNKSHNFAAAVGLLADQVRK